MSVELILVLACGVLALLYGGWTIRSVLSRSPGNARMQEIAAAIQEGARAYLNRQYTTIAMVGVGHLRRWPVAFFGWQVGLGYLIGAALSGLAGYVGMNVSVRANVRTAEASRHGLAAGLSVAFRSGAVTGMLVVGLGLIGVAGYYAFLRYGLGLDIDDEAQGRTIADLAGRSRLRRFADLDLRPSRRRHLHQGRRCRRRHGRQGRSGHSGRRPAQPRRPSPTMWATMSATAPAWRPTCSKPSR